MRASSPAWIAGEQRVQHGARCERFVGLTAQAVVDVLASASLPAEGQLVQSAQLGLAAAASLPAVGGFVASGSLQGEQTGAAMTASGQGQPGSQARRPRW